MKAETLSELGALLERERDLLVNGELEALALMMPQKERLVGALSQGTGGARARWQALERAARRNQILLGSALQGVRSAGARIEAARRSAGHLETYGHDGQRRPLARPPSALERKA